MSKKFDSQYITTPLAVEQRPLTAFGDLRSSSVGRLIAIKGHVIKVSACKPLVLKADFHCGLCQGLTPVAFEDGIMTPPLMCRTEKCRGKYFEFQRQSVIASDFQRIKLQEIESFESDTSRVPRTFDIEVRGSLVDCCISGDIVEVVGLLKTMQASRSFSRNTEAGLHQLYLLVNSLVRSKSTNGAMSSSSSSGSKRKYREDRSSSCTDEYAGSDRSLLPASQLSSTNDDAFEDEEFSPSELSRIRTTALTDGCLGLLCASMCPGIFGHELVKAGLLLGLLGGARPSSEDSGDAQVATGRPVGTEFSIRSDVHVLIVGDPGLGKSQLLRAAAALAPRAVFVCGNTTTTAGLTVAVSREGGGRGDMAIEAGALVLADRGVCCIDELDKISCDPHALLEAMEQQQISIAKSGVVTSLRSRCAILAAANPVGGHYNRRKTVSENLKIAAALLSRFDLVFILLDKPDIGHDRMISEHIMKTHAIATGSYRGAGKTAAPSSSAFASDDTESASLTLSQRLKREMRAFQGRELDEQFLRKYIAYAKMYVHPVLTPAAAMILQKLYLTMRSQASLGDSIPVTTRHLESLIRLAQARARAELRDEVTGDDANDVAHLLQESLLDAFTNETGAIDIGCRGGMSLSKQVKAIVTFLSREAQSRNSTIFTKSDIEEAIQKLRFEKAHDIDSIIDVMRTECYLLLKGPRTYQLLTS